MQGEHSGRPDELRTFEQRARRRMGSPGNAQNDALGAAGHRSDAPNHHVIERRSRHRGKEIVIRAYYEITVDGGPLSGHVGASNRNAVRRNGLPNYAFSSAEEMVKQLLDVRELEDARDV